MYRQKERAFIKKCSEKLNFLQRNKINKCRSKSNLLWDWNILICCALGKMHTGKNICLNKFFKILILPSAKVDV